MRSILALALLCGAALSQNVVNPSAGGGGGSGTVTSISTTCGVTGGTINTIGTISGTEPVNAQSGASYAILTGDCGKAVVGTNAGAQAYSIAQAGSAGFALGYYVDVRSAGAGTITITPATSTINGSASLALTSGQSARVISDGVNYVALVASASSASPSGTTGAVQFKASGSTFGGNSGLLTVAPTGVADQTVINTAIGNLPAAGGIIQLTPGTYVLSGVISVNKTGVCIVGTGASTFLQLANATNTDIISMGTGAGSFASQCVRDLTVDGNMANQTTASHGIHIQGDSTGAQISGVTVQNTNGANIWVDNAQNSIIKNSTLANTKAASGWPNLLISGATAGFLLTVDGITASGADANSVLASTKGGTITNSSFLSPTTGDTVKLTAATNFKFSSNYVEASAVSSVGIIAGQNSLVSGNYVSCIGTNATGIQGGDNTNLANNFVNNNSTAVGWIGLSVNGATAEGNQIIDNGLSTGTLRVFVANGSPTVVGNYFTSTSTATATTGIDATSSNGGLFADNFFDTVNTGILGTSGTRSIIANNTFDGRNGTANEGMTFAGVTDLTIKGNVINSFGKEGIKLSGATNSTISLNRIRNVGQTTTNTYAGILLSGTSTNNTLVGNQITSNAVNKQAYGIRESTSGDGPNTATGNVAQNAITADYSFQNTASVAYNSDNAFINSPTTTTQSAGDNSTKIATTAYVTTALTPAVLNNAANAGTSAMTLNMALSAVTSGFKVPSAAGAAPTADGFLAENTTNHTHVWGSNGTTEVGAVAATGTGTATTCSNQFVTAVSGLVAPTCTTATLAGPQYANQGTTTTLLHGNGAGNPSFAAVDLANDVSGNLGVTHLNTGTGASSTTAWFGDGTWKAPGTVTSVATNNGLTGGAITTTGTVGLASIGNNAALCNNSGISAVPTTANCVVTGTGNLVLGTSPALVTPNLGIPSAIDLTNATKIPLVLTTTGTSGASTYTQSTNTLNVPQYSVGGGTNMCSDMFTTPGSITFNVTAGHVNCIVVAGTYTVTAAVALANTNVSIVGLTPGVIIKQLTAGTDLFTVTGNFTTLQGVTLDKNSATGGALVNSSASNLKIQNVNIQNPGTNSGVGTIALTNGSTVLIDTVNFTTTITDTGISIIPVNSATMDNVVIQNVSGAMGTSLTAFFEDTIVNASGATLSRLSVSRNHITSTGGCIHVLAGSVGAVVDYHIDQNECYGSGGASSTPDGIAMFAGQHGTVNGNIINDKGQGRAGYPLALNDMADGSAIGNTITNTFGFNSGIRILDSTRVVVANNAVNGIGNAVGLNGLLISTAATSGVSSDNIITGNIMTFLSGAAGTCFTIDEGTSSGVTNNTLVSENKCIGDGSANQVGITFSRSSTGTTNNSRVTGNVLQNLVTGISIGSSVVGTTVGPQTFINTKVEYSDSGTTTHYDPQCHTYTLGVATTNFTVTQDGGPVNTSAVLTAATQSVSLFTLCPLCVVTGITVKNGTAWAATGLTSLLSTVGDSIAGTTLYTSSTYDLRSAVTNTNFQDTALFKHGTQAGSSVQASLVANQNLNANQLSGSTDYRVCWAAQ